MPSSPLLQRSLHRRCGVVRMLGGLTDATLGAEGQAQVPEVPLLAAATACCCKRSALTPACALSVPASCAPPASLPYPLLAGFSLSAGLACWAHCRHPSRVWGHEGWGWRVANCHTGYITRRSFTRLFRGLNNFTRVDYIIE